MVYLSIDELNAQIWCIISTDTPRYSLHRKNVRQKNARGGPVADARSRFEFTEHPISISSILVNPVHPPSPKDIYIILSLALPVSE